MEEVTSKHYCIKNLESPFTELFSLLSQNIVHQSNDELRALCTHSENAIDLVLRGMQDMGESLGALNKATCSNLGLFISALANLSEALMTLNSNASYLMRTNGVIDY